MTILFNPDLVLTLPPLLRGDLPPLLRGDRGGIESNLGGYAALLLTFIAAIPGGNLPAAAQSLPPVESIPNTIERTLPKPGDSTSLLPENPASPPEENLSLPSSSQSLECEISGESARFPIQTIKVEGNTVLKEEIQDLIDEFQQNYPKASLEELICLRSLITQLYVNHGYITSGAFILNNQWLHGGIFTIQVVEGEMERIHITGLNHLQESYVRNRLNLALDVPLKQQSLVEALQLLQLDPLLEQVNGELTAGKGPGYSVLLVNVKEAPLFNGGIEVNNYRSTSIGEIEGSALISHNNVLGFGDRLTARYGITEGLNIYDLAYSIYLNPHNGTLSFRYSNSDSQIIEDDFQDLDIESETRTLSFQVRQPLWKTPTREFALSLALDLRESQTFLLDEPFSFSLGPEEGESRVTVIRFAQSLVNRNTQQILAFRSQFSLGLDAFDATINNTGTDGRFFSWLGQFQGVQKLSDRTVFLAKVNAQLTADSLLPLERFALGGVDTVRGYGQNQLVTDNGIVGSMEIRVPLTSDSDNLQIVPFFDLGTGWNNDDPDPDPRAIASLGLGLRWRIADLDLHLDYGIPLMEVDRRGEDSLQENGFSFSLRYQPF